MVIGSTGCLGSMGIFTDDEIDLISSSLRLFGLMDNGGVKLRLPCVVGDDGVVRKSINDIGWGF